MFPVHIWAMYRNQSRIELLHRMVERATTTTDSVPHLTIHPSCLLSVRLHSRTLESILPQFFLESGRSVVDVLSDYGVYTEGIYWVGGSLPTRSTSDVKWNGCPILPSSSSSFALLHGDFCWLIWLYYERRREKWTEEQSCCFNTHPHSHSQRRKAQERTVESNTHPMRIDRKNSQRTRIEYQYRRTQRNIPIRHDGALNDGASAPASYCMLLQPGAYAAQLYSARRGNERSGVGVQQYRLVWYCPMNINLWRQTELWKIHQRRWNFYEGEAAVSDEERTESTRRTGRDEFLWEGEGAGGSRYSLGILLCTTSASYYCQLCAAALPLTFFAIQSFSLHWIEPTCVGTSDPGWMAAAVTGATTTRWIST